MYQEKRNSFSIRDIVLQLLFVVLFIFILVWLFPTKNEIAKVAQPFYNRMFSDNLLIMRDAAKSYFTNERLPQKEGDTVKITLADMQEKKLLIPFKDGNGNSCDATASYVEVTKDKNEYVMKVNLKCTDNSDYILVNMGCYDYCQTTICEKKDEDVPISKPVITRPPTIILECNLNCTEREKPNPKPPVCDSKKECCPGDTYPSNPLCPGPKPPVCDSKKECCEGDTYPSNPLCPAPKEKTCKYTKVNTKVCKEWNPWTNPIPYDGNKDFRWTEEIREQGLASQNVQTGWKFAGYDFTKPIYRTTLNAYLGSYTGKTCEGWTTVKIKDREITCKGESYVATQVFTYYPPDTAYYRYEFVSVDYSYCGTQCKSGPRFVFKVYKKNCQLVGAEWEKQCTNWKTTTNAIYGEKLELIGWEETWTPIYKTQKYYRYQTCKTLEPGGTSVIWSKENDKNLLDQGYKMGECITK